jgi:uncharacterized protein Smg (DUF494 family)
MIECEDCRGYANKLLENGDIQAIELDDLIVNRHVLKGCDKIMNFDVNEMNLQSVKAIVNMLIRLVNFESDRVTTLQNRVLELEKICSPH